MAARRERRTIPAMKTDSEPGACRIERTLGRHEPCPGAACAFWDEATEGSSGGCPFRRVDFGGRKHLAAWLHDLRAQLEDFGRPA
jgi:hypothetical protein